MIACVSGEMKQFQCPICTFADESELVLTLHVEEIHLNVETSSSSRGNGPRLENDSAARSDRVQSQLPGNEFVSIIDGSDDAYITCPEEDCGETIRWGADLREHLDFHLAEQLELGGPDNSLDISDIPRGALPTGAQPSTLPRKTGDSVKISRKRQGQKELGPYAFETKMPDTLFKLLQSGAKVKLNQRIGIDGQLIRDVSVENEIHGFISIITNLVSHDKSVERAFLCHPSVQHVFKLPKEGGFCGYRNIQMMISFILANKWFGYEKFDDHHKPGILPGVIELQKMIEDAWSRGFNAWGRDQTGGICGTRKFIGTPEVVALLDSVSISTIVKSLYEETGRLAYERLFDQVEEYFSRTIETADVNNGSKVIQTSLPPIYLQKPGHSVTIIGLEIHKGGKRNLLVFDPGFKPSPGMVKLLANSGPSYMLPQKFSRTTSKTSISSPASKVVVKHADSRIRTPVGLSLMKFAAGKSENLNIGISSLKKASQRDQISDNGASSKTKLVEVAVRKSPSKQGRLKVADLSADEVSKFLNPYRRGSGRLKRHTEFELVMLNVAKQVK